MTTVEIWQNRPGIYDVIWLTAFTIKLLEQKGIHYEFVTFVPSGGSNALLNFCMYHLHTSNYIYI